MSWLTESANMQFHIAWNPKTLRSMKMTSSFGSTSILNYPLASTEKYVCSAPLSKLLVDVENGVPRTLNLMTFGGTVYMNLVESVLGVS
jgi:hypothetical protein